MRYNSRYLKVWLEEIFVHKKYEKYEKYKNRSVNTSSTFDGVILQYTFDHQGELQSFIHWKMTENTSVNE